MLSIESVLAVLSVLIAFLRPSSGSSTFDKIEAQFQRIASRRRLAVGIIFASTLISRLIVLPAEPVPDPAVHDEFAYLLQADTFAHGRLTNPSHPMWVHFETFHVIFQPTYCAKFFPGQASFLTVGKILFGNPYWGVWLTSGLMCAAVTWMLQGWLSPAWALLGGVITVLRFGIFGYWANSYWGGNVAAIGGALLLGALPRIKASQTPFDTVLMGVGLVLLALSRPWEGLVLGLGVAVLLLVWMLGKDKPPFRTSLIRIVLPLSVIAILSAGWLGYYCWRTTGSPLETPYSVYEKTYATAPYMIWQHVEPQPVYRHEILRKFEVDHELALYRAFRSPVAHMLRVFSFVGFYLGPILLAPFMLLFLALPYGFSFRNLSPTVRSLLVLLLAFAVGTEMAIFYNPHYSAPITSLIVALLMLTLHKIRRWNRAGLFLSRAIPLACVFAFLCRVAAEPLHIQKSPYSTYYWHEFFELHPKSWFPRSTVERSLLSVPGKHLVIVRYRPDHEPVPDWVYNAADIDDAHIVWARDMGSPRNEELLSYYRNRQVWLLEADEMPPRLTEYNAAVLAERDHHVEGLGLPTHE